MKAGSACLGERKNVNSETGAQKARDPEAQDEVKNWAGSRPLRPEQGV